MTAVTDATDARQATDATRVTATDGTRQPTVTHPGVTVTAGAVLAGGLTLHRQPRATRHHVTRDGDAALSGVRHLIATEPPSPRRTDA